MMFGRLRLPELKITVSLQKLPDFLGGDSSQSFETPKKNNHSVTAPSTHICLVSDSL